MVERLRRNDALSWAAIGAAGGAVAVACFLPGVEIALEAFVGAGDGQRGFRYARRLSLASDLAPLGPIVAAAGVGLVAAGLLGILRGSRPLLVVTTFVVSLSLGLLVFDVEDPARLQWTDPGVIGYESPSGGPLLQPALDDLKAAARSSPDARQPGWELLGGEHGFTARGLRGWRIVLWATLALLWLTSYRLVRLHWRPWASVWIVLAATAFLTAWLFLRGLGGLQ